MIASAAPVTASLPEVEAFLRVSSFRESVNKPIGFQELEAALVQYVMGFGEGILTEPYGLLRMNPFYSPQQCEAKVNLTGTRSIIPAPDQPPPLPGNSASGTTENHREGKAKHVLYCRLILVLKQIFMVSAPDEIAFMKDPIFGFANVTTNEMFAAIFATHGTVTPAAKYELRQMCRKAFSYGVTLQ
jgi:hypothetical protein